MLSAGLQVDGMRDAELTSSLQVALCAAQLSFRESRDASMRQSEENLRHYNDAIAAREYERAIAALHSLLTQLRVLGQDSTLALQKHLEGLLSLAQADLAAQESARANAASIVSSAEAASESKDYRKAIEWYTAALALDVNDPQMVQSYRDSLEGARAAEARSVVKAQLDASVVARLKLSKAEEAMAHEEWMTAMNLLNDGLVEEEASDQVQSSLRSALCQAEASLQAANHSEHKRAMDAHLSVYNEAVENNTYELAIESLQAMLAEIIPKDPTSNLVAVLRELLATALADSAAAEVTRKTMLEEARSKLLAAASAMKRRDFKAAVELLRVGLDYIDTDKSDEGIELSASLRSTQQAAQQERRRHDAHRRIMDEKLHAYTSAAARKDYQGAIVALRTMLAEITEMDPKSELLGVLEETLSKAKAERAAQVVGRQTAHAKLTAGETAIQNGDWEAAVELLSAGLAIEHTDDEQLKASLEAALQIAQFNRKQQTARFNRKQLEIKGQCKVCE
jgi:tetratricopeptide (TPR) repeat protein